MTKPDAPKTTLARAEQALTASIDDYLLAVADGLARAQQQLSQTRIQVQPGEKPVVYQLPRLDFEMKMAFELSNSAGSAALVARPMGSPLAQAGQATAEVASTLRGSFVAVPADGGRPPTVVRTALSQQTPRMLEITITVASAAGELLQDQEVQFNVDRRLARELNQQRGRDRDLDPKTQLTQGVVPTNREGQAHNTLLASAEALDTLVPVVIDTAGETFTVLYRVAQ